MNSTWRRQFLNTLPVFAHEEQPTRELTQLDDLNNYIKILRRKEDLLYRAYYVQRRCDEHIDAQIHLGLLRKELDHQKISEQALLKSLEESNSRLISKTALYSVFSRVVEILEISRQRVHSIDGKVAQMIEIQRRCLSDFYNKMLFDTHYDAISLINQVNRLSAERTIIPFSLKNKPSHSEQQYASQVNPSKKRSTSEATFKITNHWAKHIIPNFMQILSARKLQLQQLKTCQNKKKLQDKQTQQPKTQQVPEEKPQNILNFVEKLHKPKKQSKLKPKKVFGILYSILRVRNIYLDQLYMECSSVKEVEEALKQDCQSRNESTKESIEQFRLNYDSFVKKKEQGLYRVKIFRQKYSTQESGRRISVNIERL